MVARAQIDRTGLETTVGRTPWDAGVVLLLVLGRAVPYITILVVAVYAVIEVSEANERARSAVVQEYATRVEKLIELQESGFKQYEGLRTGQIETLEKLTTLTGGIIASTERNQQLIIASQERVGEEREKLADAQSDVEEAERNVDAQQQKAEELQAQLVGVEARLDLAYRITEYVASGGPDRTPRLTRTALSESFEASAPDAVRTDTSGVRYYGIYRITSTEMDRFIEYCLARFPVIGALLTEAGGQEAAQAGNEVFRNVWARNAFDPRFSAAQGNYITQTSYEPFRAALRSELEARFPGAETENILDLLTVQAVVWSVAVQHALRRDLIGLVLARFDAAPTAEEFIGAVYDERRRVDYYFPDEPLDMQRVLEARYVFERQAALDMLREEMRQADGGLTR